MTPDPGVRAAALAAPVPTYVYDIGALHRHAATVRAALPDRIELLYAMKANPDPVLLNALRPHVTGYEVASGGELAHLGAVLPGVPAAAMGGPGKTDTELRAAVAAGVRRVHVESRYEVTRLDGYARAAGRVVDVLLRVNIPVTVPTDASLVMGGGPAPFGLDPGDAEAVAAHRTDWPGLRVRGIHAHLASGVAAPAAGAVAAQVVDWAVGLGARHGWPVEEVNLGGGMAVPYEAPDDRFDWAGYGDALAGLLDAHPGLTLRIEPGRSLTVYCGWYVTRVLDVKRSAGQWFAIVAGGTHHLRTPATKGHSQPLEVLPSGLDGPASDGSPVTIVGQLCTPKDVLARGVTGRIAVGDTVAFAMAGAYAWNISHHDFLMHPRPEFVYVNATGPDEGYFRPTHPVP